MSLMSGLADMVSGALAAGGLLMKGGVTAARLEVAPNEARAKTWLAQCPFVTFQFNPESIKIDRYAPTTTVPVAGQSQVGNTQVSGASENRQATIQLTNIVFDCFETRPLTSVYTAFVQKLELYAGIDPEKHAPAWLYFNWGKFSEGFTGAHRLYCKLEKLEATYTMFHSDGTPLRAKCNMTLKTGNPEEQPENKSPDHAKLVTVLRGQSITDIAYHEYDDPREWRRIADANQIDDPTALMPGTRLIVPPILKR